MPGTLILVIIALLAAVLVVWGFAVQRRRQQMQDRAVERLGFSPCPDKKAWLEETVAGIDNNRGARLDVRDPKCLSGASPVYTYVKWRRGDADEEAAAEKEILFALKRPSPHGLVLIVKPSSLEHGLATRLLGSLATGQWDAQPDDLRRLELPRDLEGTNLLGALAPPDANLYDLIDTRVLGVVMGLGDAGGMCVRFRGDWCAVAGAGVQIPFRVDDLVSRIRPLL